MKRLVATTLFACWAWALVLAAVPELHEWAHGAATEHEEHECAATLIAVGACDVPTAAPPTMVGPVAVPTAMLPIVEHAAAPASFATRPPERGPPAV